MSGKLFVVSTPIGNLEDITLRAIKVLGNSDLIACEDTRTTKKLLSRHGIKTALTSYHEHNEAEKSRKLLEELIKGKDIALVSDAGTPCVSDPGFRLVGLSVENGIDVIPIPGPSAAISALVVSGLPTDGFLFLGFFPRTTAKKRRLLEKIKDCPYTLVFHESPKRLSGTLKIMLETLGDRNVCVAREMTKLYEEALRGPVSQVVSVLSQRESLKGEITVVVEGGGESGREALADAERRLSEMKKRGTAMSEAVREVSRDAGISRNAAYSAALRIWNG